MKRIFFCINLLFLISLCFAKNEINKLNSFTDLLEHKIGVMEGTIQDRYLNDNYPEISVFRYQTPSDMIAALKAKKVQGIMLPNTTAKLIVKHNPEIAFLSESLFTNPIGIGFHKENSNLKNEFDLFLEKIQTNGIYDEMYNRWFEKDAETAIMPKFKLTNNKKQLNLGVSTGNLPFLAYVDGEFIGFEVEMLYRFAEEYGYHLNIISYNFSSLINALVSKKVDLIAYSLAITEERKKQVLFSNEYFMFRNAVLVLKDNLSRKVLRDECLVDFFGKTIGVFEGTIHDTYLVNNYPEINLKKFTDTSSLIMSLKTKKVDAILLDKVFAHYIIRLNDYIDIIAEDILPQDISVAFAKERTDLLDEFNTFLYEIKLNGIYNEMENRWVGKVEEEIKPVDIEKPTGKIKPLALGIVVAGLPYSTYINQKLVGFDIELSERFALERNYDLSVSILEFTSLIPALVSGKVDIIAAGLTVTEERQKQVSFSDEYFNDSIAVLSLKSEFIPKKSTMLSMFDEFRNSYYSNLIQEKRYLLILNGLKITFIISILACIFGTLLGSAICYFRMSKNKYLQVFSKSYISIIRGTPTLVLLMILYYVVFAQVRIDPVVVAIMAFALYFSAYVSEIFRSGISGVDRGQYEAGIALGFTKLNTFVSIIIPQAAKSIIPVFKGEFISLVKMTSIVGYVAVEDLTKAGDIIRSRTFDAFFPLFMVAIIYFLLTWIIMIFIDKGQYFLNKRN
jgi:polar amino acid transport system substrate-binding protein